MLEGNRVTVSQASENYTCHSISECGAMQHHFVPHELILKECQKSRCLRQFE